MTGFGKSLIKHSGTFQLEWQRSGVALKSANKKPQTVTNSLNWQEKSDWPASNGTDQRFMQSPFSISLEWASSSQISLGSCPGRKIPKSNRFGNFSIWCVGLTISSCWSTREISVYTLYITQSSGLPQGNHSQKWCYSAKVSFSYSKQNLDSPNRLNIVSFFLFQAHLFLVSYS